MEEEEVEEKYAELLDLEEKVYPLADTKLWEGWPWGKLSWQPFVRTRQMETRSLLLRGSPHVPAEVLKLAEYVERVER